MAARSAGRAARTCTAVKPSRSSRATPRPRASDTAYMRWPSPRSEPACALEADVENATGGDDDRHDEGIAEMPLQLRHELEVHPVDAGDHGGHPDDGRPTRELLHGVVLGYRDEREMRLEGPCEQF